MVKTYLRYVPSSTLGIIAAPCSHVAIEPTGRLAFTAALEDVAVWDVRRGTQVNTLTYTSGDYAARSEVSALAASPAGRWLACGYADGAIRIFDITRMCVAVVLHGHRKAVTALGFSADGLYLASGSKDTDAVVWDVVAEAGLARLRAHKDEVTDVAFLTFRALAALGVDTAAASLDAAERFLVTCSKDTVLRVWALSSYACVATIVGARTELWSLCVSPSGDRVLAGGGDNQLRVWAVGRRPHSNALAARSAAVEDASAAGAQHAGSTPHTPADEATSSSAGADEVRAANPEILQSMGSIVRQTHDRTARVRCSADGVLVGVQAAGRIVEIYRRRTVAETRKRVLRRLRRHREKLMKRTKATAANDAETEATTSRADADDDDLDFAPLGTSLADVEALLTRIEKEDSTSTTTGADTTARAAHDDWVIASDEWELVALVQSAAKLASFTFLPYESGSSATKGSVCIFVTTQSNQSETHRVPLDAETAASLEAETVTTSAGTRVVQAVLDRSIALPGHRTDVRALAVSSDATMLLSASTGTAKVWNAKTGAAIRTLQLGDNVVGLACTFCPGDRHGIVALKDGRMMLFDLSSGDLLEEVAAHTGAIWSMSMRPDGKGFITGSADKEVKFWEFDLRDATETSGKKKDKKGAAAQAAAPPKQVLTVVHTRTLKVGDEVLTVKYSHHSDPSKLLVAVALLDSTVKIFFDDTLRFFLSLYGHKLPVMSMDISADSTLLVTGSADKNVKLWGLDFGDCHKSFLAHDESVTGVSFVANTHYFFTSSKDKKLKVNDVSNGEREILRSRDWCASVQYWDGDRFEHILTLDGHKGEVWCLATARDGSYVVSGSHDRSVRMWRRTEQQVFLEEERERELDAIIDASTRDADADALLNGPGDAVGPIGADGFAAPVADDTPAAAAPLSGAAIPEASLVVTQASKDASKGSDRLMEALALATAETAKWIEYEQDLIAARAAGDPDSVVAMPTRNPELLGLTPAAYVLKTLRSVRPGDVDQVVLVLPFSDALQLLRYMYHMVRRQQAVELCSRVALLVLRMHHKQIIANQTLLSLISGLQKAMHDAVVAMRDTAGYNAAGLRFLSKVLEESAASSLPAVAPTASLAKSKDDKGEKKDSDGTFRIGKRRHARIF